MLLNIRVKNFLSFDHCFSKEPITFSMIPGKVRVKKEHVFETSNFKALKFMSVYGPNASGKTNIVKVISFIQSAVRGNWPKMYMESHFKLNPENRDRESFFEVDILIDKFVYTYGFEILLKNGQFLREWLIEKSNIKTEKLIFRRNIITEEVNFGNRFWEKGLYDKIKIYADDIISDGSVLLLHILNKNKDRLYEEYPVSRVLKNVYNWFENSLFVGMAGEPISDCTYLTEKQNIKDVYRMIGIFSAGIKGFKMVDVPFEKVIDMLPDSVKHLLAEKLRSEITRLEKLDHNKYKKAGIVLRSNKNLFIISFDSDSDKVKCQTLKFKHEKRDVLFDFWEESDGTIRLLDLLEILIAGNNRVFVIDEIERCLHPNITYKFINIFLNRAANRNTQLLVTSHNTSLMDLDLLRRDEIQLTEKDDNGNTNIHSLEEYKIRFDKSIERAYLNGVYNAIPKFVRK